MGCTLDAVHVRLVCWFEKRTKCAQALLEVAHAVLGALLGLGNFRGSLGLGLLQRSDRSGDVRSERERVREK